MCGVKVCLDSGEMVDIVVCLFGCGYEDILVWLLIDFKFLCEDYECLFDV